MNIYDIFGLEPGCSMDKLNTAIERYKKINAKSNKDQTNTEQVFIFIEQELQKIQTIGKDEYDREVKEKLDKQNRDRLLDEYSSDNKANYKIQKSNQYNNKKANNVEKSKLVKKIIIISGAIILVLVSVGAINHVINNHSVNTTTVTYTDQDEQKVKIIYTIEPGDTATGIEQRFKCESHLGNSIIYEGQQITLYVSPEIAEEYNKEQESKKAAEQPDSFVQYTIKAGDTLPEIAKAYGVTCQQIMDYNNNITDIRTIYAGDTINIPQWNKELSSVKK